MTIKKLTLIFCSGIFLMPLAWADDGVCDRKIANLEKQIRYAEDYGNQYRVAGLQRALLNTKQYCRDDNEWVNHQKRVDKKSRKVVERENDLKKAQEKGDSRKIRKQEVKLEEAKRQLKEAKEELARL